MRTFSILVAAVLLILIASRATAATNVAPKRNATCRIVTGYGTAIGHGATMREAKEQARLNCGTQLIDQYFAQRRSVAADVEDDLALACVNLECQ